MQRSAFSLQEIKTVPVSTAAFFGVNRMLGFSGLTQNFPAGAFARGPRRTSNDRFCQIRHLHGRQRGLQAFVPHLEASPVDGLFQRLAGQHTESVGHPGFLRGLPDTARDFIHDDIVVGGVATQQAT